MASISLQPNVVLTAQGLTRRFGGLVAVNNVSFTVNEGEIFGLIGPNGAGKTTTFNLMTGLIRASGGQMLHDGVDISRLRPFQIAKRGIARTFQNIRLFGNLSVLENVTIAHHIQTRSGLFQGIFNLPPTPAEERDIRDRSVELLALVGLKDRATVAARNLPYGDQRRLEIARALALRPQILLLDEPAAGMNPSEKGQLSDFIRQIQIQFELTVLLIEHHVPLVMGLCDRIAVLDFGQQIAIGNPEQVRNDPAVIEAYLGGE
ncbi:ABC transporter ATP-binding protein [Chamaesiphon sp. VAR_48_metabat_403]|uniref:ABC transporter ATP-binding protein n=1 Tax=Chamaesiphon sp. VAR_48_metabat_403 TaxID=2964700 RepID=UPI00286E23AA|nr:ABC transporter ATP-binding protein [Chamaesiphon sp. VAR_48_metabat_403]